MELRVGSGVVVGEQVAAKGVFVNAALEGYPLPHCLNRSYVGKHAGKWCWQSDTLGVER
jgi:hypothetical protein